MRKILGFAVAGLLVCPVGHSQSASVGKIQNAGNCSFTAVNSSNSIYRISCGGKGLTRAEASQLSEVLSIVKENNLQFQSVVSALNTLAAEQRPAPSVQQNCPGGYCNNGNVNAPQTITNAYGASRPAPPVRIIRTEKIAALKRPTMKPGQSGSDYMMTLNMMKTQAGVGASFDHPSLRLTVVSQGVFPNPAFRVTCDKPCLPSGFAIRQGNMMSSSSGSFSRNKEYTTDDPRTVIFQLGDIPTLTQDTLVILGVQSVTDEPLQSAEIDGFVQ